MKQPANPLPPVATPLVECRIPTYRRPVLLARALRSLQQQSFPNWRAIVIDDSPEREATNLVAALGDTRITCLSNPKTLGAAGNLDLAFSTQPMLGGQYAFVLEDDNALEPEFIAAGLLRLEQGDVQIVSFNQCCIRFGPDGSEARSGLLRSAETEVVWERHRLLLNAFLGVSLPNGGYFWRLGADINLEVGPTVLEPQFQECIRQTRIHTPIALLPQPLSLWSMLPVVQVRRRLVSNRCLAANLNQLSSAIIAELGGTRLRQLAKETSDENLVARTDHTLCELSLIAPGCLNWFTANPLVALRCKLRFHLYRTPWKIEFPNHA